MNYAGIIVAIIIGSGLVLIGTLFKVQHWPYANVLLTAGLLIEFIAFVMLLYRVLIIEKRRP